MIDTDPPPRAPTRRRPLKTRPPGKRPGPPAAHSATLWAGPPHTQRSTMLAAIDGGAAAAGLPEPGDGACHVSGSAAGEERAAAAAASCAGPDADDPDACCYICLSAEGELIRPCSCPRYTHGACLAKWQLVSAGRT